MMSAMGPLAESDITPAAEQVEPQRTLQILLAEDSPVNQRVATAMLEKWGHEVTVAANGRQAIAMFRRQSFDLVLMDVQMPEMDGLEATKTIRQYEQEAGGHVPIVALTAHAMKGDRQRCLSAGMDGYVTKPIRSKELKRMIEDVTSAAASGTLAEVPTEEESVQDEPAAISSASGNGSTVSGEAEIVDWRQALDSLDGNRQLLGELVAIFKEECPKWRREIETSLAVGDATVLRRAAHTLKGSLAHLAAERGRLMAEQIELKAREQNLQAAHELWPRLQAELDKLEPVLDEFARQPCL
jgi:two-component system sensor histidine kinase/response regulator